jgi:hypothetical protein
VSGVCPAGPTWTSCRESGAPGWASALPGGGPAKLVDCAATVGLPQLTYGGHLCASLCAAASWKRCGGARPTRERASCGEACTGTLRSFCASIAWLDALARMVGMRVNLPLPPPRSRLRMYGDLSHRKLATRERRKCKCDACNYTRCAILFSPVRKAFTLSFLKAYLKAYFCLSFLTRCAIAASLSKPRCASSGRTKGRCEYVPGHKAFRGMLLSRTFVQTGRGDGGAAAGAAAGCAACARAHAARVLPLPTGAHGTPLRLPPGAEVACCGRRGAASWRQRECAVRLPGRDEWLHHPRGCSQCLTSLRSC